MNMDDGFTLKINSTLSFFFFLFVFSNLLGVIQFGIETEETEEQHVTAEDVKSEKPAYSEDVGTIKSGSTMIKMSTAERRNRIKSEGAATAAAAEAAEFSYREEQMQGSAFDNEAFIR